VTRPILNIEDLEYRPWGHGHGRPDETKPGEAYEARLGDIARRIGARKLGYNLTVLPPGKRAFPFHHHRVNEEMFFILEGSGEVRLGAARYPIRKGDVIACPAGGPETAHQIINTSTDAELKYLAVSTRQTPEIAEYPDSGKFAVFAELSPGPDGKPQHFRFVSRSGESLDYWEGE
jgi:uncharacterized cupin superfamily protein